MLYYLYEYLTSHGIDIPGLHLLKYISFRAAMAVLLSLFIALLYGKRIINFLRNKQMGELVRDLGLEGHFISTVHDSIVMDVPDDNVKAAAKMLFGVFKDLPKAISQAYKVKWDLPLLCEIGYGPNQKDLTEIKESDL